MHPNFDYEAQTGERLAYYRSIAPMVFLSLGGITAFAAYFHWVSWSLIVFNMLAGMLGALTYFSSRSYPRVTLALVMLALLVGLIGTFVINDAPPGRMFRSQESSLYFCQAFSTVGAGFFLLMVLSRFWKKR
jgi:hypothetical protein